MTTYERIYPLTKKTAIRETMTETSSAYDLFSYTGRRVCTISWCYCKFQFSVENGASLFELRKDTLKKAFRFVASDLGGFTVEDILDDLEDTLRDSGDASDYRLYQALINKLK